MQNNTNINETLLIESLREGKKAAFEYVFKEYYKRLCLFAQKYVRDYHTAEEIVSRIFEKLWERRRDLNISRSLSSYLFQAVQNECLNYLNSFSSRQKPTDTIHLHTESKEAASSFLPYLYAGELEEKINAGIKNLPDKCRKIFYFSRYEGLTHKEIAEKMNISTRTVENQIRIALESLRNILKSKK